MSPTPHPGPASYATSCRRRRHHQQTRRAKFKVSGRVGRMSTVVRIKLRVDRVRRSYTRRGARDHHNDAALARATLDPHLQAPRGGDGGQLLPRHVLAVAAVHVPVVDVCRPGHVEGTRVSCGGVMSGLGEAASYMSMPAIVCGWPLPRAGSLGTTPRQLQSRAPTVDGRVRQR